jgi:hypothetical protein
MPRRTVPTAVHLPRHDGWITLDDIKLVLRDADSVGFGADAAPMWVGFSESFARFERAGAAQRARGVTCGALLFSMLAFGRLEGWG